jgi:hypothetical protein
MVQYRKKLKFKERIVQIKISGIGGPAPIRPNLSIVSDLFFNNNYIKSPFLILDEVNAVKNPRSMIRLLPSNNSAACATHALCCQEAPIDNTCSDVYAFLQFAKGAPDPYEEAVHKTAGNYEPRPTR